MALRKQEYYGFTGNHFWKIIFQLSGVKQPLTYPGKKKLLKEKGIALWDVFKSCEREGALDSAIQRAKHNDIPGFLKQYPNIKALFLNGRTAEKVFLKHFSGAVKIPFYYLPSTSPANASVSFSKKLESWSAILR